MASAFAIPDVTVEQNRPPRPSVQPKRPLTAPSGLLLPLKKNEPTTGSNERSPRRKSPRIQPKSPPRSPRSPRSPRAHPTTQITPEPIIITQPEEEPQGEDWKRSAYVVDKVSSEETDEGKPEPAYMKYFQKKESSSSSEDDGYGVGQAVSGSASSSSSNEGYEGDEGDGYGVGRAFSGSQSDTSEGEERNAGNGYSVGKVVCGSESDDEDDNSRGGYVVARKVNSITEESEGSEDGDGYSVGRAASGSSYSVDGESEEESGGGGEGEGYSVGRQYSSEEEIPWKEGVKSEGNFRKENDTFQKSKKAKGEGRSKTKGKKLSFTPLPSSYLPLNRFSTPSAARVVRKETEEKFKQFFLEEEKETREICEKFEAEETFLFHTPSHPPLPPSTSIIRSSSRNPGYPTCYVKLNVRWEPPKRRILNGVEVYDDDEFFDSYEEMMRLSAGTVSSSFTPQKFGTGVRLEECEGWRGACRWG